MKKFISFALIAAMAVTTLVGCGNKGGNTAGGSSDAAITVMSREDGSGTRGAFIELFGIEEEENGEKVDKTTDEASITNSTSVMMSSVANDANAIGYISLGSLNDTVKAVKIDGAEASVDNVKNGSYKVVRPFNIVLGKKTSDAANDFVNYIMSADGQKIIEDNGYIPVDEGAAAYQASNAKGKVVVGGSSSVSPVMEKLVEKAKKAGVSELQGMVETVLNDKNAKGQIITTSFKFDEIVNLLPIIFDFKLSGSTGFPSTLQTGTFDGTSYVVASGLSNNVSKLHEYLYGEKNYVPTENVNSVDYAVTSKTGISENSAGFNPTEKVDGTSTSKDGKQPETTESSFDYDDKGKSDFY